MRIIVTGSAGHLGESLMRALRERQSGSQISDDVVGIDLLASPFTTHEGSICDHSFVREALTGADVVLHTATLHKPHVGTHSRQEFLDTNLTGTLTLLEASVRCGVKAFIYTSSTSVFGDALVPPAGEPAAWITEDVRPVPKNIYGVTKAAAEDLCQLFFRNEKLPCLVLRASRFFPEADDNEAARSTYADPNLKVNELLYRRADIEDVVSAHLLAARHAERKGFGKYVISATTPFQPADLPALRHDLPGVLRRYVPNWEEVFASKNWRMMPGIDRVYVNTKARQELGWEPRWTFEHAVDQLRAGMMTASELATAVGAKGYHRGWKGTFGASWNYTVPSSSAAASSRPPK